MYLKLMKIADKNAQEFKLFLKYSEEIGLDNSMVQAAGGNTSIKIGDDMWVKASGKWLINSISEEIMVPISIAKIKDVLQKDNCNDTDIVNCINRELSSNEFRPSVEAPMHAILDFKYVFHTHDLNVNALTVQKNSQLMFEKALNGLNWKFIPYIKPGIELCRQLVKLKSKDDNVFILENHGLIICGQDLNEIKNLNNEIRRRLKILQNRTIMGPPTKHFEEIINLKDTGYQFCEDESINALAFHQPSIDKLSQGMLLPDFLVFLGPSLKTINPADSNFLDKIKKLSQNPLPLNSCIILADRGIIVRADALKGTLEIMRCVYDLLSLIPDNADLKYLNENETLALLNWESEHYRQNQNKL
jgi:rhamnose utilization protein RhaD (predicted bifunctional aldolase and dehydrogenase)